MVTTSEVAGGRAQAGSPMRRSGCSSTPGLRPDQGHPVHAAWPSISVSTNGTAPDGSGRSTSLNMPDHQARSSSLDPHSSDRRRVGAPNEQGGAGGPAATTPRFGPSSALTPMVFAKGQDRGRGHGCAGNRHPAPPAAISDSLDPSHAPRTCLHRRGGVLRLQLARGRSSRPPGPQWSRRLECSRSCLSPRACDRSPSGLGPCVTLWRRSAAVQRQRLTGENPEREKLAAEPGRLAKHPTRGSDSSQAHRLFDELGCPRITQLRCG